MARDITDQKQFIEQIESIAKFPAENPGPILRIDLNGKLLYANEASLAYLTEWSLEVGKQAPDTVLNVAESRSRDRARQDGRNHPQRPGHVSLYPAATRRLYQCVW